MFQSFVVGMHGVRWYFTPNFPGGIMHSSANSPNRNCHGEKVNVSIQLCSKCRQKEDREFQSPVMRSSVSSYKYVCRDRKHIVLVLMPNHCFHSVLLFSHYCRTYYYLNPIFCLWLFHLSLSVPYSWGGKPKMFLCFHQEVGF